MPVTTADHGVNNYRYAKQQKMAFDAIQQAKLSVKKTGKESTGFSHLVGERIKWCPRSGLWRDTQTKRDGQGVFTMIKFLNKQKKGE